MFLNEDPFVHKRKGHSFGILYIATRIPEATGLDAAALFSAYYSKE
jgi:hypothetical protein